MSVRKGVRPIPAVALTMVAEEQAKDKVVKPIPAVALTMVAEEQANKNEPVKPIPKEAKRIVKEAEEEAKASATATGGYKKKYTVKELKHIASRNNIKTTKKLDGKTVNLNKKGLMAKLKRKKLI